MWSEKIDFLNQRNEKLAGILEYPEEQKPEQAYLILSPHPLLGGDIENNVITTIRRVLRTTNSVFLCFNYHGCGQSEIHLPQDKHTMDYYEELEEAKNAVPFYTDAITALDYLQSFINYWKIKTTVIGYSFGGYLALRYFSDKYKILAISPPFSKYDSFLINTDKCSCLLAKNDFLSSQGIPHNLCCETCDADHFFRGKEHLVEEWLLSKILITE